MLMLISLQFWANFYFYFKSTLNYRRDIAQVECDYLVYHMEE